MVTQIVKTRDEQLAGHVRRYIFGLNLLPDSDAKYGSVHDPRTVFLYEQARQREVGGVFDKSSGYTADLQTFSAADAYKEVAVGVLGGEIVNRDSPRSLFFPKVEPDYFLETDSNEGTANGSLMFHILYADALALFVSPIPADAAIRMYELLMNPFDSSDEFIREAIRIYDVVLTSHADGDYFVCYADNTSKFDVLKAPLDIAISEVKRTPWFNKVVSDLVWDEDLSCCLIESAGVRHGDPEHSTLS